MVRNPQIELRGLVSFMGDLIKRHKAQKTLFPPSFFKLCRYLTLVNQFARLI